MQSIKMFILASISSSTNFWNLMLLHVWNEEIQIFDHAITNGALLICYQVFCMFTHIKVINWFIDPSNLSINHRINAKQIKLHRAYRTNSNNLWKLSKTEHKEQIELFFIYTWKKLWELFRAQYCNLHFHIKRFSCNNL